MHHDDNANHLDFVQSCTLHWGHLCEHRYIGLMMYGRGVKLYSGNAFSDVSCPIMTCAQSEVTICIVLMVCMCRKCL